MQVLLLLASVEHNANKLRQGALVGALLIYAHAILGYAFFRYTTASMHGFSRHPRDKLCVCVCVCVCIHVTSGVCVCVYACEHKRI